MAVQHCRTKLGLLRIMADDHAITEVKFVQRCGHDEPSALTHTCATALQLSLNGKGKQCAVPLSIQGTPFQERVWRALQHIPVGQTITYAELATRLGVPRGARAIGNACGANRLLLLIPCHRVVAERGLGGYAGGIIKKRRLLALEKSARRSRKRSGANVTK